MKKRISLFLLLCTVIGYAHAAKIGLLVVATGKYIQFIPQLLESAELYFCTDHDVTYFIFTDGELYCPLEITKKIVRIEQKRLGWPHDTLMRFSMYYEYRDVLDSMDYLFATDADMRFESEVGDEILSDRVATQHPGYVGRRGTYESRRQSTAYVDQSEGSHYFAGGFNGGSREEFLKMAHTITENIQKDLEKNIIAVWHDESHLNRYFISNPPTKILSPSYCYPANDTHYRRSIWRELYQRKLVALDKSHNALRS